jgi:protein kinase C substrate 80K-H
VPAPSFPLRVSSIDNSAVAKFYKDASSFSCIGHPSIKLSISQVNDDYCDCPDGSDEPGTSACSYLSDLNIIPRQGAIAKEVNSSNALPGFYCKNIGHRPSYVPFTSVNDGICDYNLCCDGSDEWAAVGGKKCEDRCKEIGKEWKKQDDQRQKSLTAALKKRKELLVESARLRKEVEDRIKTLETEIGAQDIKVENLEKEVADVEKSEKHKVIKKPASGGKIGSLAVIAKGRTDELRESLARVRVERDDAIERLEELEKILSTFKEEYNPNFNDEGVKRAVRSWENYAARDMPDLIDEAVEKDLDEIMKDDKDNGLDWNEWTADDDTADTEVCKWHRTGPLSSLDLTDHK